MARLILLGEGRGQLHISYPYHSRRATHGPTAPWHQPVGLRPLSHSETAYIIGASLPPISRRASFAAGHRRPYVRYPRLPARGAWRHWGESQWGQTHGAGESVISPQSIIHQRKSFSSECPSVSRSPFFTSSVSERSGLRAAGPAGG